MGTLLQASATSFPWPAEIISHATLFSEGVIDKNRRIREEHLMGTEIIPITPNIIASAVELAKTSASDYRAAQSLTGVIIFRNKFFTAILQMMLIGIQS